jgi:hypothetical protein
VPLFWLASSVTVPMVAVPELFVTSLAAHVCAPPGSYNQTHTTTRLPDVTSEVNACVALDVEMPVLFTASSCTAATATA